MSTELQITTDKVSVNKTQLTVKVPVDQIQSQVESRIRKVAKTAKIDGFRKGKVPVSHIRTQHGAGIQQEVINDVIRDTVFEAIRQQDVHAVSMPNIDEVKLENDFLVYQATVEVFPEIDVQGIDEIEVERHNATISEADVDTMIESLREQRKELVEKEGAAAEGDTVTLDFEGSIEGEIFEGGNAENFKLNIGSKQMIPGFEEGIVGMSAGDDKTINLTFPEDYQNENLAGKEAQFKINVHSVEQGKLPDLNDEFFALFNVSEGGLEQLRLEVRKNMEREIKNAARAQVKQMVFDALLTKNQFEVPNAILEQEIERQRNMMMQRLVQQSGSNPENFTKDMLPNNLFEEQALQSARLGILVSRIIATEDINLEQERVDSYIKEAAENYEDPAEVIEYYTNDKQQRANIESIVLEDQVIDHLLNRATVTEKEVSYKDLLSRQKPQML